MSIYSVETTCRSCGSSKLRTVQELGSTPLADRLVTQTQLQETDVVVPLTLLFCEHCSLVQIKETVQPTELFGADYPYYSSVSESLLAHFAASATQLIDQRALSADSLVIEAASNDGYLLRHFVDAGIPVLGIDPASGPVAAARARGVATHEAFFGEDVALDLRAQHPAGVDLFLANNVLAHVADLNGFVSGIQTLLHDRGMAVIEVPYLIDLVDHCEFDTIYHQHLCYFSVTALNALFRRHGLYLNEVRRTWVHGGSLRLFVEPTEQTHASVYELLNMEADMGVNSFEYLQGFAANVMEITSGLRELLAELRSSGHSIAGYGAAAKATTLMSVAGIGKEHLDYIVDRSPHKHGLFMGGNRVPILAPEVLLENRPDYLLLLAWNFADEIMSQQTEYARAGGSFIVPVPKPGIVA